MTGIQFYIVDTETTGLDSAYHELNEISIIRCKDRIQLTEFVKCDYPERANFDSLAITNKTIHDLHKGNSKEIAIDRIDKFLNEDGLSPAHRCFVAHNYSFDKKFIHKFYEKVNKGCPVNLWLCTMALTKQYAKNIGLIKPKVNLHASCELVGIKKLAQAHTSKIDARNTFLLHKDLVENKKVDYLPFIKTAIHQTAAQEDEEIDMSLLEP